MKPRKSALEQAFGMRVTLLETTLAPATIRQYRGTAKRFLRYMNSCHAGIRYPSQLRRDPHILGFLEYLWTWKAQTRSGRLSKLTRAHQVIQLRKLLDLLADHSHPPPPGLVLSEDIPRPEDTLARPLRPEDDARLQLQLRSSSEMMPNALLLQRLTGMRIGECVDLAPDCLRHLGDNQWVLHVPLGKLHSERWVPVDDEVRLLVERLLFLRTVLPGCEAQFLLPRPKGRGVLCVALRAALRDAAARAGIDARILPHQLRHTFATEMVRAGVSLPALMKMLGHRTARMTLRYVEITQRDLQREFQAARIQPRHQMPVLPTADSASDDLIAGSPQVRRALATLLGLMDLYRQQPDHPSQAKPIQLLYRRLTRIRTLFEKLTADPNGVK